MYGGGCCALSTNPVLLLQCLQIGSNSSRSCPPNPPFQTLPEPPEDPKKFGAELELVVAPVPKKFAIGLSPHDAGPIGLSPNDVNNRSGDTDKDFLADIDAKIANVAVARADAGRRERREVARDVGTRIGKYVVIVIQCLRSTWPWDEDAMLLDDPVLAIK